MTLEEIKKWFEENKEDAAVVAYLLGISQSWIQSDEGKEFLESAEGKALYQAEVDRRVTGGIETFKEKSLPELIKTETDKLKIELAPKETPEQKRIAELEEKQLKSDEDLKKSKLKEIALQTLNHKKLNSLDSIIDQLIGNDETATLQNIENVADAIEGIVKEALKEAFPDREILDTDESLNANTPNPWDKKSEHYNVTEQSRIFQEKPALAKKLMKLAG